MMLRVALVSVLARKRRLFTTGFAIVLSVAFISGTLVITALIDSTLDRLISSNYQGIDAIVRSSKAQELPFGQPLRPTIPTATLDFVRGVKGVRNAEGLVSGLPTLVDKQGERIQDIAGPPTLAFNWIDDPDLQGAVVAPGGRAPAAPNDAVLDVRTAKEFGFKVGDRIQAGFPGGIRTLDIVGLGGVPNQDDELVTGARVILLTLDTAREVLKKDGFDYIAASADRGVTETKLTRTLRKILPSDQQAITGQAFITESDETITKIIGLFATPILAFGYIAVFVGAFVIYNTFSIVVAQRTRELALLRAVGASRRQILGSVMVEAVLVGLVASALGVGFGWLLSTGLKAAMAQAFSLPAGLPPLTAEAIVVAALVGVGSTVASALIPGIRATFIPPVAAFGEAALDRTAMSPTRRIVGSLVLVAGVLLVVLNAQDVLDMGLAGIGVGAGLLFIAFATIGPVFSGPMARALGAPVSRLRGVSGRIGRDNAARNPKRTAVTATALSVGVCLVIVVAVFAASLRSAIESQLGNQLAQIDLIVESGTGFGGLGPEPAKFIAGRPEVAEFTPIRFNPVTILNSKKAKELQADEGATKNGVPNGDPQYSIGVDAKRAFELADFDLTPRISDLRDDEVIVLQKTATANGWKPGDRLEVWFPRTGRQTWKIAAVVGARVGTGSEFITNLDTVANNATPEFQVDQTIWVRLRDGVSPAAALKAMKPELKKLTPTAALTTVSRYVKDRLGILDSVVNLIYVLLGLSIVIALVGVGNTISLSIHERTRELGLLRAVGMARRQLGESVEWESAIIALAGTVAGLVLGVILAVVLIDAWDEQGVVPVVEATTVAVIGGLGALAGVAAAIRPAWRATKVDVLAAIASV